MKIDVLHVTQTPDGSIKPSLPELTTATTHLWEQTEQLLIVPAAVGFGSPNSSYWWTEVKLLLAIADSQIQISRIKDVPPRTSASAGSTTTAWLPGCFEGIPDRQLSSPACSPHLQTQHLVELCSKCPIESLVPSTRIPHDPCNIVFL